MESQWVLCNGLVLQSCVNAFSASSSPGNLPLKEKRCSDLTILLFFKYDDVLLEEICIIGCAWGRGGWGGR